MLLKLILMKWVILMLELTMYNACKHFGETLVLHDVSFKVYEGEKVGIVGVNGSGKSTVMKLLAGLEPMDIDYRKISEGKSRISITKGATVGYLEQLPSYPGLKVNEILHLAFQELKNMERQLAELESSMGNLQGEELERVLRHYSEIQQRYELKGGYDREEKLSKVCIGLKFNEAFLQKDFEILSGGEKTTVMLGKVLLESPDVLLLDEPTNHLDMQSMEWLEGYLKSYRGMVIIVSHDRYFLDKVVTKIVEIENHQSETYDGNYSDYIRQKDENMLLQYEQYKEQQKKVNAMEKAIRDLRDWAQRADNNKFFRRAVSMQLKLDKMEKIDKPKFEKQSIKVNFKAAGRSGYEIVKVCGLSKSFEDKVILSDAGLYVTLGERVALIGANGSGKSTFIKMLLGEMAADQGTINLGASLKIAYLPQNVTFNNEEDMVIDCFRENRYILEGKAREYLSKFMFFGRECFKKVKHLSGGEKVRLKLGMLLYDEVNLLILDEPTNHLDIESIETLEEALEEFEGTILFISHDRFFINKVCSRVVAIEENKFASYDGNYDFYKNVKYEQCQPAVEPQAAKKQKPVIESNARENKKQEIETAKLESDISSLESELNEIDRSMTAAATDHDELNRLYCEKEELSRKLDKMIEMWLATGSSKGV